MYAMYENIFHNIKRIDKYTYYVNEDLKFKIYFPFTKAVFFFFTKLWRQIRMTHVSPPRRRIFPTSSLAYASGAQSLL